ncbi:MAG: molybdopterin-dependent oxidoreductase [Burkholderiaceae bacterium]|nr:molybdopterin-dependent oxidoreductase [Burkholderiaceae bacterium]
MSEMLNIEVVVNGQRHSANIAPNVTLLDFLRDDLKLKGAKECCGVGECGACTVSVDGETVNSCLFLAVEADGAQVRTVEGLAPAGDLSPLQESFLECGAVQCGFCIPGMVMSAQAVLDENPAPDESVVREGLSGNLCRCGGYNRMFAAMKSASRKLAGERPVQGHCHSATGKTVGTDVVRSGGAERLTGAQAFLADLEVANVLHLKLVTLDVARARIDAIDATAARALPGVVAVISAADLPQPVPRFGPVYKDRPILAVGETKYHGEPVAVVAAETLELAELAASLVKVQFTPLPHAVSIDAALAEGAPLVPSIDLRQAPHLIGTNVMQDRNYGWGDVAGCVADVVVENTYTFPMVTHFAIEPIGMIVDARKDWMKVWSPVQHPFLLQKIMADLFELPLTQVHVIAPDPGGGFGGKQNPKLEPLCAYVSMQTGRPCRLVMTLEETFQAMRRAGAKVSVRSGFALDGTILFQDIQSSYLIGAYVDIAERVMTKGNYLGCGPYRVPNARIHAQAVMSHTTPSCAFRGFGTPQIAWAIESQMDAAARQLGFDGLQIRLKNLAHRGDEVVKGDFPADGDWPESVRQAADAIGWDTALPEGRGRGIAVAIKSGATTGLSNSTVRLLADGSVILYAGTSDMGQGARTIFAQLVADAFGAPLDRISVVMGDTSVVPFDLQTSASRSTVFMGTAIMRACADICEQVVELATDLLGISADQVRVADGMVHLPDGAETVFEFVQKGLGKWNGELIGNGRMRKPTDKIHPLGGTPAFFEFNCSAFEVSVDRGTGEILIHKHVTVGDVGKALNPLQVEMQDEGAAIMGLGHSMMEHLIMNDKGAIRNLGALDYRIPTTKDMPLSLVTQIVENQDGPGPYGAKGVSEGAILCTAPALAAALTEATGVVVRDLPLTPERVWSALHRAAAE